MNVLETAAGWITTFVVVDMTRGLLLFILAWVVTRVFRTPPGRTGHLIWLLVILAFVLLPLSRLIVPPVSFAGALPLAAPPTASSRALEVISSSSPAHSVLDPAVPAGAGRASMLSVALSGAWILGALFFVSRILVGWLAIRRVSACARVLKVPSAGGRRAAIVLVSELCAVPFTFGLFRPKIVLPEWSRSWKPGRLRAVLAHELSHVRRLDAVWSLLAHCICASLWFLPQAWIALSFMHREAEKSCDLEVVSRGIRGADYAGTILEISRRTGGRVLVPGAFGLAGRKSMIRERITGILSWSRGCVPRRLKRAGLVVVACFALLLPLMAITCTARSAEKLHGTWVNTSASGMYKWTFNADGTATYVNRDGSVKNEGRFVIEKKWNDEEGNTWYKTLEKWHIAPYKEQGATTVYSLAKIDRSGNMLESDASIYGYPEEFFGPAGVGGHLLCARQGQ